MSRVTNSVSPSLNASALAAIAVISSLADVSRAAVTRLTIATSAAASAPPRAAAAPPPGVGSPLASARRKACRPSASAAFMVRRTCLRESTELVVPDVLGSQLALDEQHPKRGVDHRRRAGRVGPH